MRFEKTPSTRFKICALSAMVVCLSSVAGAEELKVVDVAGNTRLLSEIPLQDRVGLEVVLASAETYPVEVRLSGLQNSDDVRSIQVGADGRGTFSDVGPGGYQLYTSAGANSISDVQITREEPQQVAALVGGQTGATDAVGEGVVGDVAGDAAGAGAGGGGTAGIGLGAVGAVGAVGGGVAILASSVASETDGSSKPAPSPTPAPPPSVT